MKISKFVSWSAAASVCGAVLVAAVLAQDTTTRERRQARNGNSAQAKTRAGVLDSKTSGASIRASKLIGMNIENSQQKDVGEIKDIVLDSSSGKIQYVAVTYGGFLGVGNKLFAVPFEALRVQRDPDDLDDPDDYVLVLDVTERQLEGAKGFDEDNWPNFADENFTRELYKRYDVSRRNVTRRDRTRDRDVKVDRNGIDVDVDRDEN